MAATRWPRWLARLSWRGTRQAGSRVEISGQQLLSGSGQQQPRPAPASLNVCEGRIREWLLCRRQDRGLSLAGNGKHQRPRQWSAGPLPASTCVPLMALLSCSQHHTFQSLEAQLCWGTRSENCDCEQGCEVGEVLCKKNHFLFCETIVSNCAAVPLVVTCSSLVNTVTHFTRAQVAFSTRLTMGKRDNTHPIVIISDQSDGFQTSFSYLLSQL